MEFLDLVISNEDVKNCLKPHLKCIGKQIYMRLFTRRNVILEDSPMDYASRSKSHMLRVKNTKETNYNNIHNKLNQIEMGEQQTTFKR